MDKLHVYMWHYTALSEIPPQIEEDYSSKGSHVYNNSTMYSGPYYYYTGILMGSLQLPIALIVHDSLGGSSSYCTLISQSTKLSQAMPYFTSFSRGGISTWWQVNSIIVYIHILICTKHDSHRPAPYTISYHILCYCAIFLLSE